jgi:hypothetical protein
MVTVDVPGEEDASTLATGFRFTNEGLGFALLSIIVVLFEVGEFCGKAPSDGEEVVVFWELLSELHEAFAEEVFSGEDFHTWEMIDFLIGLHACKDLLSTVSIDPAEVKIKIGDGFSGDVPLEFFSDKPNDRVLAF